MTTEEKKKDRADREIAEALRQITRHHRDVRVGVGLKRIAHFSGLSVRAVSGALRSTGRRARIRRAAGATDLVYVPPGKFDPAQVHVTIPTVWKEA